jgi:hypothetical protein
MASALYTIRGGKRNAIRYSLCAKSRRHWDANHADSHSLQQKVPNAEFRTDALRFHSPQNLRDLLRVPVRANSICVYSATAAVHETIGLAVIPPIGGGQQIHSF